MQCILRNSGQLEEKTSSQPLPLSHSPTCKAKVKSSAPWGHCTPVTQSHDTSLLRLWSQIWTLFLQSTMLWVFGFTRITRQKWKDKCFVTARLLILFAPVQVQVLWYSRWLRAWERASLRVLYGVLTKCKMSSTVVVQFDTWKEKKRLSSIVSRG